MSIIRARRIPSGLGYLPNTTVRAHTVRGGLGVEEALGWFYPGSVTPPTTPTVDPNTLPLCKATPKGLPCRDYIGGSATVSTGPATTTATAGCTGGYVKNVYGYCVPPPTPTKSTDWGALASSLTSMFAPKPAAPAPAGTPATAYMPAASGGMSKGTMIAIGAGVVGLVAVFALTRK
jgi:hypothetical protein